MNTPKQHMHTYPNCSFETPSLVSISYRRRLPRPRDFLRSPDREISCKHPLLARINLVHNMPRRPCVPRLACIRHNRRQHPLLQLARLLDRVDVQSAAHVPRNVAMEGPRAGIVRVVLQNDVCRICYGASLDQLGVTALRVLRVGDVAVPYAEALGEHVEIVSVEMHWVGGGDRVIHYETHGGVGSEVEDGPVGVGVGKIARVREGKDGVAVDGG